MLQTRRHTARSAACHVAAYGGLAFLLACGEGEEQPAEQPPVSPYVVPSRADPVELPIGDSSVLALDASFGSASQLSGVAVGQSGERYVLEQGIGLYRLDADGGAALVLEARDHERYGLGSSLALTDVVAYEDGNFLLTAENDGYLFDLDADSLVSYFCYEPGFDEIEGPALSVSQELGRQGVPVVQLTNSVAFNGATGEILAQPQTFRLDGSSAGSVGSEVFLFGPEGGQPKTVLPIADLSFSAGGMVVIAGRLLLGAGNGLYELWADGVALRVVLATDVVVTGLALDRDGSLLVLDGANRRLIDYDLSLLPPI